MRSIRRQAIAERLARLEAQRPQPTRDDGIPIPSEAELAAMSDEELNALCERVLAQVELSPEELVMTDEELHEHCCRLVKEDQMRSGLFN